LRVAGGQALGDLLGLGIVSASGVVHGVIVAEAILRGQSQFPATPTGLETSTAVKNARRQSRES
jgi:hypothetical protein